MMWWLLTGCWGLIENPFAEPEQDSETAYLLEVFDQALHTPFSPFEAEGLSAELYERARVIYQEAQTKGVTESSIMTIVDLSQHSREKRLWTIDFANESILFYLAVSHGRGSDPDHDGVLNTVSNVPNSKQSSAGLYKTAETYFGKHGYSLKLDGLEKGFNDKARERAIVVHGADYMTDAFIAKHGKAGRSFGCPAVSDDVSKDFIDTIKDGTLYWIYVSDEAWL